MKSAKPIAAGKKVKCAKCAQVFTVVDEEEEKEAVAVGAGAEKDADETAEGGDEEKPQKSAKSAEAEGADEKKAPPKKGKGLMIGLIAGGLLLCCCCSGGGTGGWFVWDKVFNKPPFWGAWHQDGIIPAYVIGFESNGTGYHADLIKLAIEKKEPSKEPNMKWKRVGEKSLEISLNDKSQNLWTGKNTATFDFVVSGNELTLTDKSDSKATKWRKADDKRK
jgi:hypothetical protein